jgi:hypothetical protein
MIFFNRDKEKQQQKQREKEEKKQREEQEKQLEMQQKEEQKQLEKQQKEQKELEKKKDVDLATLSPIPIANDEQTLYRFNLTKGTFRTKVVISYFVTNYRIVTLFQVQNNPHIMLENISDVVAINTHREYEGGYRGVTTSYKGMRYTTGGQRGKSVTYGDLIISSPVAEDQTWYNIRDYNSVIRLIKSLRKTRLEQIKQQKNQGLNN